MEFTIRAAKLEDLKAVQKVAITSWHATYEGIIPIKVQDKFLSTAYSDSMLERRINYSLFLVAEVEDSIIGFANFSPVKDNGEMELGAIYLYPEYQGCGIGSALLQKGIELTPEAKKVFINVEKDNELGKNFYIAKGFQIVSEFDDDFDGHILRTIRMVLNI